MVGKSLMIYTIVQSFRNSLVVRRAAGVRVTQSHRADGRADLQTEMPYQYRAVRASGC